MEGRHGNASWRFQSDSTGDSGRACCYVSERMVQAILGLRWRLQAPGRVRVQDNSTGNGGSRDEVDGAVGMVPTGSLERFIQPPSGQRHKYP